MEKPGRTPSVDRKGGEVRRGVLGLVGMLLVAGCCWGQDGVAPMAKGAKPVFDVVTIHPTPETEKSQGFQTRGSHVKLLDETVKSMIMFAYGVHGAQIVNAPAWIGSEAFDADGIPDVPGEAGFAQMQDLVKQLLADRFGFKFHQDKKELSYFALRVAGGSKLAKSVLPDDASADSTGNGDAKGMTMKFTNSSMHEFLVSMQYFVDRPLVDESGLKGKYDFELKWMPDDLKVSDVTGGAPGLFTAMKEELGLKFEGVKGPVDVMVVDKVERPSAN